MNEVFSFVDASHLIAKVGLWRERDKAIKEKYDRLNNEILPKVAVDKQAICFNLKRLVVIESPSLCLS